MKIFHLVCILLCIISCSDHEKQKIIENPFDFTGDNWKPPVLTLSAEYEDTVYTDSSETGYTYPDAVAENAAGQDISHKITRLDGVDLANPGTYTVHYLVEDTIGEKDLDSIQVEVIPWRYLTLEEGKNGSLSVEPDKPRYAWGEELEITAEADAGYWFEGWSNEELGKENPVSLQMDSSQSIAASFRKNFVLDISAKNGTVEVSPDKENYPKGVTVTLEAEADAGYWFEGWSNEELGKENPVTFQLDSSQSLSAYFVFDPDAYQIDYVLDGGENHTDNPGRYGAESETILLRDPVREGYAFTGWYRDSLFTDKITEITQGSSGDIVIYAQWEIHTYELSVEGTNGSIEIIPDKDQYDHGETVSLTASADSGYWFDSWTGDIVSQSTHIECIMDTAKSLQAVFQKNIDLILDAENGRIEADPAKDSYSYGDTVYLTALPDRGYSFYEWGASVDGNENPLLMEMRGKRTIRADFVKDTYEIHYALHNGRNNPDNPEAFSIESEDIELLDPERENYHFTGWYADSSLTQRVYFIDAGTSEDVFLYAGWEIYTYDLSVSGENGSVHVQPEQEMYEHGESVQFVAEADSGYWFKGWSGAFESEVNPVEIEITGDMAVAAEFHRNFTVSVENAENCHVDIEPKQDSYPYGMQVTLRAVPDEPIYDFVGWGKDVSGNEETLDINITGNLRISAVFIDPTHPENMVLIPSAGETFTMGAGDGWEKSSQQTVTFTYDYYMGIYPVTQKQYSEVVGSNPSHFEGENLPVEMVTWYDAARYCNLRSVLEGREPVYYYRGEPVGEETFEGEWWEADFSQSGYRLPTEAEWEYAAQGGQGFQYASDDGTIDITKGNYFDNNIDQTTIVWQYPPNPFGLYDMVGNVREWTNDWYGDYSEEPVVDPTGVSVEESPTQNKILRSGYYDLIWNINWLAVASRTQTSLDETRAHNSFRVVLPVK